MRQAYLEKVESQKMKQKARERMQPKMGKLDIDYQVGACPARLSLTGHHAASRLPAMHCMAVPAVYSPCLATPRRPIRRCCTTPSSSIRPSPS